MFLAKFHLTAAFIAILALASAALPAAAQFGLPAVGQPAKPAPADAGAADKAAAERRTSDVQALDRVIDLLRNDQNRNTLLSDLERMRGALRPAQAAGQGLPQAPAGQGAGGAPAAAGATAQGGAAPGAPSGQAAPPDQPNLLNAVIEGVASAGRTLPSATFGYPIGLKLSAAFNNLSDRLNEAFRDGSAQHFLAWAAPGWAIALALLFGLPLIPSVRRGARIAVRPLGARNLARMAFVAYLFRATPVVLSAAFAIAWPNIFDEDNGLSAMFVLMLSPILVAAAVAATLNPLLYGFGPSRGWRLVSYAQGRLTPWIAILAGLANLSTVLRLPVARRHLGWDLAGVGSFAIDLALCALTLVFVVRHRRAVRRLLVGARKAGVDSALSAFRRLVLEIAQRWHAIAIAFVSATAVARIFDIGRGELLWPAIQALGAIAIGVGIALTMDSVILRRERRLRRRGRPLDVMVARYLETVRLIGQVAMMILMAGLCLEIWGFAPHEWSRNATAVSIVHPIMMIAWVLLFNWVIWVGIDGWIEGALAMSENGYGGHKPMSARTRTLLPLLRNAAFVSLAALTLLAVLSNLGLNVGPLLAGAGVVGLAIGFGSQELVKDVITGLFILIEDTIAIGDTVNTGDRSGVVEGLTIRTVKLRDGDGSLHSIPFSQIKALKNSSRGYSVYQVKVTIAYDADLDRVIAAMREVGAGLLREQRFGADMLAPLDVWGVDDFTAEGVVIKGSIKTRPLRQWGVGREFNRRLKQRLDHMGVAIYARKGEDTEIKPDDLAAAAGIQATS